MNDDANYCSQTNQAKYRKALATQKSPVNQHNFLLKAELLDHQSAGKNAKIQFSIE